MSMMSCLHLKKDSKGVEEQEWVQMEELLQEGVQGKEGHKKELHYMFTCNTFSHSLSNTCYKLAIYGYHQQSKSNKEKVYGYC